MTSMEDTDDRTPLIVEVCVKPDSTCDFKLITESVQRYLHNTPVKYQDHTLDWRQDAEDALLLDNVLHIRICDTDLQRYQVYGPMMHWDYLPHFHVYQLCDEAACDDDEGEEGVPAYSELTLPALDIDGQWEALQFDSAIQRRLLQYAHSALLFADHGVDANLVSWNRVVLLHGPPGTGKTSLCKALAQKLTIRLGHRYRCGQLVEVNAHSLFSKWFSESGKLVSRLFARITEVVEEEDTLVFVLIDEVESLTAARKAAVGGSEPSDAVRAVNALLTQLDKLKRFPNVLILTTSNITEAIDVAFVDRADIKAYIGPPSLAARYEIVRASLSELQRARIVAGDATCLPLPFHQTPGADLQPSQLEQQLQQLTMSATAGSTYANAPANAFANCHANGFAATHAASQNPAVVAAAASQAAVAGSSGYTGPRSQAPMFAAAQPVCTSPNASPADQASQLLLAVAAACQGLSGRTLRKLPFIAHAGAPAGSLPAPCGVLLFLRALHAAALREQTDRSELVSG